jgi:hypothetical protein
MNQCPPGSGDVYIMKKEAAPSFFKNYTSPLPRWTLGHSSALLRLLAPAPKFTQLPSLVYHVHSFTCFDILCPPALTFTYLHSLVYPWTLLHSAPTSCSEICTSPPSDVSICASPLFSDHLHPSGQIITHLTVCCMLVYFPAVLRLLFMLTC